MVKESKDLPSNVTVVANSRSKTYFLNDNPILLLDPDFKLDEHGKLYRIIGKCNNIRDDHTACQNLREISPSDAFQVKWCIPCTKLAHSRKIAERRKLARKKARIAALRPQSLARLSHSSGAGAPDWRQALLNRLKNMTQEEFIKSTINAGIHEYGSDGKLQLTAQYRPDESDNG